MVRKPLSIADPSGTDGFASCSLPAGSHSLLVSISTPLYNRPAGRWSTPSGRCGKRPATSATGQRTLRPEPRTPDPEPSACHPQPPLPSVPLRLGGYPASLRALRVLCGPIPAFQPLTAVSASPWTSPGCSPVGALKPGVWGQRPQGRRRRHGPVRPGRSGGSAYLRAAGRGRAGGGGGSGPCRGRSRPAASGRRAGPARW